MLSVPAVAYDFSAGHVDESALAAGLISGYGEAKRHNAYING